MSEWTITDVLNYLRSLEAETRVHVWSGAQHSRDVINKLIAENEALKEALKGETQ